jgi:hypothetical protein
MAYREEWDSRERIASPGLSAVSIALLFGSAAVALALVLTPLAEDRVEQMAYSLPSPGIDMMPTGTVGQRQAGTYTVRRSVLQPTPASVCIIRQNGMRTGDC